MWSSETCENNEEWIHDEPRITFIDVNPSITEETNNERATSKT